MQTLKVFNLRKLWLSLLLLVGVTAIAVPGIQEVAEGNGVAQIGDKYYETLQAAFDVATDGQTITLLCDITQDDGIKFDRSSVSAKLDLNNHTLTVNKGGNVNNRAIRIDNGTLEVCGGSVVAAGSGTTSSNGTGCYGAFRVEANGKLIAHDLTLSNARPWGLNVKVLGGEAELTNVTINSSYGGGIEVTEATLGAQSKKGKATLTDCNFTQENYFDHCSTAISVSGGSEVVVNSGFYIGEYALYVFSSGGVITINGGTFEGRGNNNRVAFISAIDTKTYPEYTGGMQLNDGTFKGNFSIQSPSYAVVKGGTYTTDPTPYLAEGLKAVQNNGTWTVQEKYVAEINNVKYSSLEEAAEAAKSGDTIVLLEDIDLSNHARSASDDIILTGVTLDLNGKTIRGFNSGVRYSGTGAVIKNGTFDFVEAEAKPNYGLSIGSYISKNHDTGFTLQDLTVKGGINIDYADVTLNDVDIDMGASTFYAIWVDEDGASATYNSGAITASTSATAVFGVAKGLNGAADGSIKVTGGKILTNGKNLRLGGKYLPVEVSGGVFDAAVPEDCCAEGIIPTANTDEETKATYPYTVKQGAFVAQIEGGAKYETLQSAIDAAETGATINILKDYTLTTVTTSPNNKYNVNVNKSVTINGDGHTITSSEGKRAMALTGDGNNITLRNLTVVNNKSDWCVGILNNPTVTLDATTIDGSGYNNGYNQPLTIGGSGEGGVKLNVTNGSVIKTNDEGTAHYSIIAWRPAEITVTDSELKGWAAIYFKPAATGSTATVENCTLTSKNPYSGNSNQFGVFSIEATNVTVDVTNSTIDIDGVSNKQAIVNYGTTYGDCTGSMVNLGDGNKVTLKNQATFTFNQGDTYKLQVSGGLFSEQVPEENCAEGIIPTANTDEATSATYPYTVKEGSYVAQIEGGAKYETLEAAIEAATAGQNITLLANIDTEAQIEVGNQVTLDLNGKTIEYKGSNTLSSGVIMVLRGGDLTITDSSEGATGAIKSGENAWAAIALTKAGETSTETAKLTVEKGLLEGYYYAITGNGSRHGTDITINGGVIKGTCEGDNLGIYHPQDGTLTINGGTISGYGSAVEMRAGTLNVKGGTLSASCTEFTYNPNDNGSTTNGAVIAIAQHNTLKAINVNVSGATLNGAKTIAVTDAQKNNLQNISVTVADGLTDNSYIPAAFKWVSDGTMSTLRPRDPVAMIGGTVYYSLNSAIDAVPTEGTETTITLLANVTEDIVVKDGKNIVLDLGEKTLTGYIDLYDSELNVKNGNVAGTVYVNGGPASAESSYNKFTLAVDATITADFGFILYQGPNGNDAYGSVIDINGTVNGTAWVMGNITEGNSVINVNNGAKIQGEVFGLNGLATLNVKEGATIIGSETGIEVRAGNLNVEGGTITSTATEYKVESAGSGTTTTGAAIAISQHTTGLRINANILGGTLSGIKTISVADPEGKNMKDVTVMAADALANAKTVIVPEGYIWISDGAGISTLTKIEDGEYKLIDGKDYPFMNLKSDISVPEVTYQRSFKDTQVDKHQGWYVPMDYTITAEDAENFTFYKLQMVAGAAEAGEADPNGMYLYVTPMNVGDILKGNRPYTVKPKKAVTHYIFTAKSTTLYAPNNESRLNVTTSNHSYDFYGRYVGKHWEGDVSGIFFLNGGSLHPSSNPVDFIPYRWDIKVSSNSTNDGYAKIGFIIVEDGDATGINSVREYNSDEVEGIYTINGKKLDSPVKGINIIKYKNGKTEKRLIK